jgi:hypothetical protein
MKYLCLVCIEEKNRLDALSSSEFDALCNEALAYEEDPRRSGHFERRFLERRLGELPD